MRRELKLGLLAALAALALPASAAASTAEVNFNGNLFYFAAAGETNNLTLERVGPNYVLSDPGAAITPLAGCAAVNASTVSCGAAPVRAADLRLGNLNDAAVVGASVTGLGNPDSGVTGVEIRGEAGDDTLTGGPNVGNSLFGQDPSSNGPGTDVLIGGLLRDNLNGSDGNDQLTGAGGDDSLTGGIGNDTMSGGDGFDNFSTGSAADGADVIDGGEQRDFLSYEGRSVGVSFDADGVADDGEACPGGGCEGDNVTAVESLDGGDGNDTLTGSAGPDSLSGGDGNDAISGGGGPDQIDGDDGEDQLSGGDGKDLFFSDGGSDVFDGGADDDRFQISSEESAATGADTDAYIGAAGTDLIDYRDFEATPLTIDLDGVADDGQGCPGAACEGDNVGVDIEDVIGGERDDTLIGNDAANEIDGGGGNDTIAGGGGADGLAGGDGGDAIDGGAGVDSIEGGGGVDSLRSRDGGADQIDCGSSADSGVADALDQVEASCEALSSGLVIGAIKKGKKRLKLELGCPAVEAIACAAKLQLKKGKKVVATGKATIPAGTSKQVKLKLKGKAKGTLEASANFVDAAGVSVTTTEKLKVGK